MANGINTNIFDPKRKEQSRQNLYETITGQKVNPQSFLQEEPEAPEMDDERREQLQRLSRVSAIASGVDAITDAIGVGTSDDYAPAPSRMGELGVSSFNTLAGMDQDYRNRLDQYRKNVFNTRRYNQQARQKATEFNRGVDLQLAQAKYKDAVADEQAAQEAQQEKERLEREGNLRDTEAYREAGLRLISQGKEKAGIAALAQGGLSTEEITEMLGRGGSNKKDPVVESMIRRYQKLDETVSEDSGLHFTKDGKPISAQAREMMFIQDELGRDLYNPIYQQQAGNGPGSYLERRNREEQQKVFTNEDGETFSPSWFASPQNMPENTGTLNPDAVRAGLNSPESIASENRDLVQQIQNAPTEAEAKSAIQTWTEAMKAQNYSDQDIEQAYRRMMGSGQGRESQNTMAEAEDSAATAVDTTGTQTPVEPVSTSSQPESESVESFEEFREQLNQQQVDEFSAGGRQRRETLVNVLNFADDIAGRVINVATSPFWVLKSVFEGLSERRQKELFEKYKRYQQEQSKLANNNGVNE